MKQLETKLLLLILYQFIGGLIGLYLTISSLISFNSLQIVLILFFAIAIALNFFSIFCSILIYNNTLKGLVYSRFNQYLQILGFYILGFGFRYVAGLFITIGLNISPSFQLDFNLGLSAWQINLFENSNMIAVEFNLIALLLIIYLDIKIKKINDQKTIEQFSDIGEAEV